MLVESKIWTRKRRLNPLKQVKSFGPGAILKLTVASVVGLNPLKQVKSFGPEGELIDDIVSQDWT